MTLNEGQQRAIDEILAANQPGNFHLLTGHGQGSTIKHAFMDVADIRRRADSNVLECQQLCYVAATRATHTLNLIGV